MFYSDTLPEKIIAKLKEKGIYNDNDRIVAFYDDTMFLTGNKGIVCTQDSLYIYTATNVNKIPLVDVKDILFREIDKEKYIYKMIVVNKKNEELNITPGSIPNDEMHLLVDVINLFTKK